ncbi:asparagine synthase (glutamine-hydrolyzing) [candidate division KSB1 bacterium]|nr:asparagine synthase (glutamine-hydrolyzing) [candidate division KSB1 bacterium]
MIWGIIKNNISAKVSDELLKKMSNYPDGKFDRSNIYVDDEIGFGCQALPSVPNEYAQPVTNSDKSLAAVFQGQLYNRKELAKECGCENDVPANVILKRYQKFGDKFVEKMNGKFAFAIYDRKNGRTILGRDRVGIEPLFYHQSADQLIFSTSLAAIVNHPEVGKEIDYRAVYQFLQFCYNPALFTFFKDVHKLRPGHLLIMANGTSELKRYWQLSFAEQDQTDEREVAERLLSLMRDAVSDQFDPSLSRGVFLSGGMDSSTMVALTSEHAAGKLSTFSFRCRGESFDESHYAKIMADHYHTSHNLVEYQPDHVQLMADIVRLQDEPFCDLGINIATYLLGRQAQSDVATIFTGDGGDELYGGHPVYEADKMAQRADKVPGLLLKPVLFAASHLPDSDKKKNFVVKAKRFALSYAFPSELFSHRWRIYYTPQELRLLMTDHLWDQVKDYNPYEDIYQFNREADGTDQLSRSLYSDYQTVVGFYLRRIGLLKHFGIDARFPLLDHRLIEYCARIPADLKIKGNSDTKYIFKKAMANVLPHDIVYRKDKLGHSIPMKNWMRENAIVKQFISDQLSESAIKQRGLFNPAFIKGLMDQHQSKKANFSHRLWALAVLELWLGERVVAQ